MRRMRAILCGVLAALMLAGCGGVGEEVCRSEWQMPTADLARYAVREAVYPAYPQKPRLGDYTNETSKGGSWDAYLADWDAWLEEMQAMGKGAGSESGAVMAFAERTAAEIVTGQENTVYSPAGLYAALGVLAETAEGETKRQVLDLLDVSAPEELERRVRNLWSGVYVDDEQSVCRLASAVFLWKNADVKQVEADALAEGYYASAYRLPMGTEEADKAIASWLNRQTGIMLAQETGDVMTETDDLLRLYSTIYYRAGWGDPFTEGRTERGIFAAADGSRKKMDFMYRNDVLGSCRKGEGYIAAPRELGQGRMVFVLPEEGVTPDRLLQREGFLKELTGEYDSAQVIWSVPKFDVKSTVDLKDALRTLGVTDAFDGEKADLTPLADNIACVDGVTQAVRVKIDEAGVGVEAYPEEVCGYPAVTEMPPMVEMTLDRPFVFVIFSDDNVPLFVGAVQSVA